MAVVIAKKYAYVCGYHVLHFIYNFILNLDSLHILKERLNNGCWNCKEIRLRLCDRICDDHMFYRPIQTTPDHR